MMILKTNSFCSGESMGEASFRGMHILWNSNIFPAQKSQFSSNSLITSTQNNYTRDKGNTKWKHKLREENVPL